MPVAYHTNDLYHHAIQQEVERSKEEGFIIPAQVTGIREKFPCNLFSPRWTVQVGLAMLTLFASSTAMGFFMLALDLFESPKVFLALMTVLHYAALEWLVNQRKYYRAGIDAILSAMVIGLAWAFLWMPDIPDQPMLGLSLMVLSAIAVWLSFRFHAAWIALVAWAFFLSGLCVWAYAWHWIPLRAWPLMLGGFGLLTAYAAHQYIKPDYSYQLWKVHAQCLYVAGTLLLALSVNYQVVWWMRELLMEVDYGKRIIQPLPFYFRILTLLVPLAMCILAFFQRNRLLWWVGMFTLSLGAYTLQQSSSMEISVLMIAGGLILGGLAAWSLRTLRVPIRGYSNRVTQSTVQDSVLQWGVSDAVTAQQGQVPDSTTQFGGGSGGGGGASASI
jgi:hypothetical protein